MFSSGISVYQVLGLISIFQDCARNKGIKKWQLVSSERETLLQRHFSASPWEGLIAAWGDDNFNTSRSEVMIHTRGQPETLLCLEKKKAETILEDSGLNPLSSFTVQSSWPRFLTLSEAANRVTIKRKRQRWKLRKRCSQRELKVQ